MYYVKFISNNDEIRMRLPYGMVKMNCIPLMDELVSFGSGSSNVTGRVTEIKHIVYPGDDMIPNVIQIYLSKE